MTHACVAGASRDAAPAGYAVIVASDAAATRDIDAPGGGAIAHDALHRSALVTIADAFGEIISTDDIVKLPVADQPGRLLFPVRLGIVGGNEIDKGAHFRRQVAILRVKHIQVARLQLIFRQYRHQRAAAQILMYDKGSRSGKAQTRPHRIRYHHAGVGLKITAHADLMDDAIAVGKRQISGLQGQRIGHIVVTAQVRQRLRYAILLQVGRCRHQHHIALGQFFGDQRRIRQRTRDPQTDIEFFRNQIDEAVIADDIHPEFRILTAENCGNHFDNSSVPNAIGALMRKMPAGRA